MADGSGSQGWTVVGSEVVFDNWITVVRDRVRTPRGAEVDFHYLSSNGSASVLAFTTDDQVVLTRQYRHPLRRVLYDLPAGGIRPGELPEQAARRELAEETGYVANEIELLGRFNPLPGTMAYTCHVYLARDLQPGHQNLDEHEIIDVVPMPWQAVVEMVLSGEAVDGALVYAVLRYLAGQPQPPAR